MLHRIQQTLALFILVWNAVMFYLFASLPLYETGNGQFMKHETLFQAGITPQGAVLLAIYGAIAALVVWYGWQSFAYQCKALRWMWLCAGFILLYSLLGMMTIGVFIAPTALLALSVVILGQIGGSKARVS